MHFNLYNPSKMLYVKHPIYGAMELPKHPSKSTQRISVQANNYIKRLEYEKYLNPKGLKPTITSHFSHTQQVFDFAHLDLFRIESGKHYGPGIICFKSPPSLSKPEVKQFLIKLYDLPVLSVRSILMQGRIRRAKGGIKKEPDYKKWIVKVGLKKDKENKKKNN